MKGKQYIWLLEMLSYLALGTVLYWQWNTLPALRTQIHTGLLKNMETVAEKTSEDLSDFLEEKLGEEQYALDSIINKYPLQQESINHFSAPFASVAMQYRISNAWALIFPDSQLTGFEFKLPGRNTRKPVFPGIWQESSSLVLFCQEQLREMYSAAKASDWESFWENIPEKKLFFSFSSAFQQGILSGVPLYKNNRLEGFLFRQLDTWYIENELIPRFFNFRFPEKSFSFYGLPKEELQFAVTKQGREQPVYNSVVQGSIDFPVLVKLRAFNALLNNYFLGIRFRGDDISAVSTAIYRRNLWLFIGLMGGLFILVFTLFRILHRLMKLSQLKSSFIANVSHELKTPLTSIKLVTDSLKLGRLNSEMQQKRGLDILTEESSRLERMIFSLLDFAQLEAGKRSFNKASVSTVALWEYLLGAVRKRAGTALQKSILTCAFPKRVYIDLTAIEQAVLILIDNALKYTDEPAFISFTMECRDKVVVISVQDRGYGIAASAQKDIFDTFVRAEGVENKGKSGYGLGLSIAKGIMKAHKGSIYVKSKLKKGSIFFLELPVEKNE